MKFTLFLPMYNVESHVISVLDKIPTTALASIQQIILIDNQSSDNTLEVVTQYLKRRADKRFHLYLNKENYFLGGSTIIAFQKAISFGSDFMICLHSDGQADPKELLHFIEYSKPELDFVLGSRMLEGSNTREYSSLRLLGNKLFSGLQQWITKEKIVDIGAYISFNLKTIAQVPYEKIPCDMSYQPLLILYICLNKRIKFKEFPITWGKVESSSVNLFSYGLKHLLRLLPMLLGYFPLNNMELKSFETCEVLWWE